VVVATGLEPRRLCFCDSGDAYRRCNCTVWIFCIFI